MILSETKILLLQAFIQYLNSHCRRQSFHAVLQEFVPAVLNSR